MSDDPQSPEEHPTGSVARTSPRKSAVQKVPAGRKAPARKAPARKAPTAKAPARKVTAHKTAARTTAAGKGPARKAPARKTSARKTAQAGVKARPGGARGAGKGNAPPPGRRPPRNGNQPDHPPEEQKCVEDHDVKPAGFVDRCWVKRVFDTPDTPLRTHRITLSYSKFGSYLDDTLFAEQSVAELTKKERSVTCSNANWFNFACWGTYTLGPNIRNQGAPQRLDAMPKWIRRRFAPGIIQSRGADGQVVGRALAWGQELIFLSAARALVHFRRQIEDEVGPPPARGGAGAGGGPGGAAGRPAPLRRATLPTAFTLPQRQRDAVLKHLNWGGEQWVDDGHLQLVQDAFECYRLVYRRVTALRASGQPDIKDLICNDPFIPKLMLYATLILTAAEQAVVNKALAVVVESVPIRFLAGIERQLAKAVQRQQDVPSQVVAVKTLTRLRSARTPLFDAWARLMTDQLLVIVLPTEMLRLGRDVPLLDPVSPMYPDSLRYLQNNARTLNQGQVVPVPPGDLTRIDGKLTELRNFVAAFDRSSSGRGSAARDWRRFDDRLNWATALFRSRQQDSTLFWPPYSVEDTVRIRDGELPRASGKPGQDGSVAPPLDPDVADAFLSPTR